MRMHGLVAQYRIPTTEVVGSIPTLVQLQATLSNCVLRPTQPPILSGTRNEYQPMGGDALCLGNNGRYGLCLVAGKTLILV